MRRLEVGSSLPYGVIAGGLAAAVCLLVWAAPNPSAEVTGPQALLPPILALLLSCLVVALAVGLGRRALRAASLIDGLDPLETLVYSFALGMGLIGLGIYALGVSGLFRPGWLAAFLAAVAAVAGRDFRDAYQDVRRTAQILQGDWQRARVWKLLVLGLVVAIGLLTLIVALAPPWAYDGLMYHLQAPRLFLEQGRIVALPAILQANGPLLGQMLYSIGLAFGSDVFSQVIHLAFAWVLLLAVLAAGRRLLGPPGGWVAAGVLLGIPIFPLWGTLAYVDMTQAVFEFLAVWALMRWRDDQRRPWLGLSAVLAGLALGTKQIALFMLPAICLWLVLLARRRGWLQALGLGLAYGLVVCLVAAPWYLFSLISLGDPLYPFLRGDAEWPMARLALHLDYLRSFGTGRSLIDFILLPWNLYFRHEAFAALMATIEYPSFLFPLALLVPVISISPQARPLAALSLLRLGTWYLGSQQTRFLLPLYPVWCLMVAAVLLGLEQRLRLRLAYPRLTASITAGLAVTTLAYASIFALGERQLPVVAGLESRASFLTRLVYDYRAMEFIVSDLPPEARVLQLWDGQGYYCDGKCIPDAGQVQAPYLHGLASGIEEMQQVLVARGATHVLVDLEGLNFLLQHDSKGSHLSAARFFLNEFLPACGEQVYQDPLVRIFRLSCPEQPVSNAAPGGPSVALVATGAHGR